MSIEKAIKVLGLPRNFTEEELKSSYYKLCKENHPDHNGEATLEKQKEINCAHDVLKTYLKEKNLKGRNNSVYKKEEENSNVELEQYRKEISEKLEQKISFPNYETIVELEEIKDIIFDLEQYQILFIVSLSKGRTKEEIDKIYQENMHKIQEEFKRIAIIYCQKYDISKEDVKEKINPHCNIDYFYKQLTVLKNKYSKLEQLKERLEEEIYKYKTLEYYNKIKQYIEKIKDIEITKIRNNNYQNIDEEIAKMHQDIVNNILNEYKNIEGRIKKLANDILKVNDESIHKLFNEIKEFWYKNSNIDETKNSLNQIDIKLEEYKEQEDVLKLIQPIYDVLVEKHTKSIKEKNVLTNYSEIKKNNELFEKLLELLKAGCKEKEDITFFNLFNQIQFQNYEQDKKALKIIMQKIRKIYVKKKGTFNHEIIDKHSFFWIDEKNLDQNKLLIYRINPKNIVEYTISKKEFEDDYIALDELLTSKSISGIYKKVYDQNKIIFILAENENFILYKNNEDYIIGIDVYIDLVDNYGKEELDKEEIINLITQYLQKRIQNYKNTKKR